MMSGYYTLWKDQGSQHDNVEVALEKTKAV